MLGPLPLSARKSVPPGSPLPRPGGSVRLCSSPRQAGSIAASVEVHELVTRLERKFSHVSECIVERLGALETSSSELATEVLQIKQDRRKDRSELLGRFSALAKLLDTSVLEHAKVSERQQAECIAVDRRWDAITKRLQEKVNIQSDLVKSIDLRMDSLDAEQNMARCSAVLDLQRQMDQLGAEMAELRTEGASARERILQHSAQLQEAKRLERSESFGGIVSCDSPVEGSRHSEAAEECPWALERMKVLHVPQLQELTIAHGGPCIAPTNSLLSLGSFWSVSASKEATSENRSTPPNSDFSTQEALLVPEMMAGCDFVQL